MNPSASTQDVSASNQDEPVFQHVKALVRASIAAKEKFYQDSLPQVVLAAKWMAETVLSGGRILIFGNGGSAADAQHMAAEMVGRMLLERRKPLAAVALTTDTSGLTAIGNDYSFEDVFSLQVQALGKEGDLAVAISTSGNSKNVLKAVRAAKAQGMRVVAFTGGTGGALRSLADICLCVEKGENSSMIQETHITLVHNLVDVMDRFFLPSTHVIKSGGPKV
jgi:D-sedoheptulose 7-phosphate isomerase